MYNIYQFLLYCRSQYLTVPNYIRGRGKECRRGKDATELEATSTAALLNGPRSSTITRHRDCDHRISRLSVSLRFRLPSRTVPPLLLFLLCRLALTTSVTLPSSIGIATRSSFPIAHKAKA